MSLLKRFRVNTPDVVYEIIDGELVVLDLKNGVYFSLNDVGVHIWELADFGHSLAKIVAILETEYRQEETGLIKKAVEDLLDQLCSEKLLVEVSETSQESIDTETIEGSGALRDFKSPLLEKYTDMEDLLRLDPIHEVAEAGWPKQKDSDET